jgi:uracil-DNA glycosylase
LNNLLHRSWLTLLDEKIINHLKTTAEFLHSEKEKGKIIFPAEGNVFRAFEHTPLDKVKIVILGQDPYHDVGQAHGLAFSVPNGIKIPPSLKNIFKELEQDVQKPIPKNGDLSEWAQQGILLLNSSLTVEAHEANSHATIGWQVFTDEIIKLISQQQEQVVFMLWGKYAQQKSSFIDSNKHLILTSSHPSPLSAYQGFLGCKHFSKANEWLIANGMEAIKW